MACNKPLKAYARPSPIEPGKKELHFVSQFTTPSIVFKGHLYSDQFEIPCGQCMACRLKYSRDWATRCMLEASQYEHNYFVTLTYNDYYVPQNILKYIDKHTGEFIEETVLTLRYKDVQDFLKRLRTKFKRDLDFEGVRFYGCQEYGPTTNRPHYHMILFNCPLPDLKPVANNFNGDIYYESEFLNDVWSVYDKKSGIRVPIGYVSIAECSYQTCAYVARYMTKKHKGLDAAYYSDHNIAPEGSFMSRKPGIARNYFDSNSDKIYEFDQIIITGSDGKAKRVRPPRYYDNLYDIFSPEDYQRVKQARVDKGRNSRKQIEERTSLSREDYLTVCENKLLCNVKSLPRDLI